MAAAVTLTEERLGTIKKITWEWTAHTDGKVATATPNAQTAHTYTGTIERLVTVPATGADQPTDNYTVKVYDEDNTDVLMNAAAANRDNTNTEQVAASSLGVVANDKLTLYVEGAGSGKKGTVHLYIRG